MIRRSLRSAAYAASLFAADVVLLVLYLNPRVTLRGDGGSLALVLFLPYAVAGTLAFWSLALLTRAVFGWPRTPRPPAPQPALVHRHEHRRRRRPRPPCSG